jgi:macrolide transport system ATP-binding/permease protein
VQAAQAEMTRIAKLLHRQYSASTQEQNASVVPLAEIVVGDVRPILLTLMGGAGLLLLISCVNVASLVIPKDMAFNMPFLEGVGLNSHTCAFATSVALLATLLLAASPQIRLSSQKVRDGMIDGNRSTTGSMWQRFGSNLVIVEIAIAVVLLASAGLLGQSLYHLLHVSLGFEPGQVATLDVTAPNKIYDTDMQMEELYQEVIRRVAALPGVESAGMTSLLPVQCDCNTDNPRVVGKPDRVEHVEVNERHVSAVYLSTLKAKLIRGRYFTPEDNSSAPGVVVINQSMARRFFPHQNPIGQRIANEEMGRPSTWQIIGVIDDVHEGPLDAASGPAEYFPVSQTHDRSFTLIVRTQQSTASILPVLVSTLHQVNPELATSDEGTLTAKIDQTQAALLHSFSAWLVAGFALIALVLAVVGLYGIVAYSVSQRTREIGIRMAIGAQRSSVYVLVTRQAGWLTLGGLAIGLACSLGVSLLMRKLLFGVQAWDPTTLGCVTVVLGLSSMAASFLPARRAAAIDPMNA